jgi:hypothetical protein
MQTNDPNPHDISSSHSHVDFGVYYSRRVLALKGEFPKKFIKHFVRKSWSPAQVKTQSEHDSKWPKDRTVKAENFKDLNRKC